MATQPEGQEVTEEVETTSEQDAAAFNAGFDGGEQTTTPDSATVETGADDAGPSDPPAEQPKFAQITEEQFQTLMKAASDVDQIRQDSKNKIDVLSGHVGGLKQKLEQLQQTRNKLTPGQLKRVNAELPELGKLLEEDLGEALTGGSSQFDPEEIDRRVQKGVTEKVLPMEKKLLRLYHRDWEDVVRSDEFKAWQTTMPADKQAEFLASIDGEYIADVITDYKTFKAKQATPTPTPTPVKQDGANRQRLLAAAAQPKGSGGHAGGPTDEDQFIAGFKNG